MVMAKRVAGEQRCGDGVMVAGDKESDGDGDKGGR
jgi:hypothetical protein